MHNFQANVLKAFHEVPKSTVLFEDITCTLCADDTLCAIITMGADLTLGADLL